MAEEANIKDRSLEPKVNEEYTTFLRDIRSKSHTDFEDKQSWRRKMMIAVNQRQGVKRWTSYPYPGAPDIPLPETDKLIKKAVPNLVLSAVKPKKMCRVEVAEGIEETDELRQKACRSELAMNMYLRSPEMDWFRKLCLAADNRKQYGHCIFKIYEKFLCTKTKKIIERDSLKDDEISFLEGLPKTEKALFLSDKYGFDLEDKNDKAEIDYIIEQFNSKDDTIEFTVTKYKSMPMIDIVDPIRLTVPSYTQDINEATRVREEFFLPRHSVEQLMDDDIFLKKDLEEIPYWSGREEEIEATKSRNEGITDNTARTDIYRMEMISCWYRDKKTEPFRRKVFTFFADVMDPERALVQDIDFPFEFQGWFYEKSDNEIKDSRYFDSRGVPEQIRAIQEVMERCINNKIIRDEFSNTPVWEVLDTSDILDAHIPIVPGAKLPVKQLGAEIKQVNEYPKPDTASSEIMNLLKAYAEEYLAVNDQLFRNASNSGGGKTLGEIELGMQQNAGPLNLDVTSWNESLSKVYRKMFDILAERLDDSIYVDGQEITAEDFDFPALVTSNGDVEMANQQLAEQKANMRLNVIMNPVLQDIVDSEDRYFALKDWLEKSGVKDPDKYCTDPKIIMQTQLAQMKQQLMQMQQQMQGMQDEVAKEQKNLQSGKRQQRKIEAQTDESMNTLIENTAGDFVQAIS